MARTIRLRTKRPVASEPSQYTSRSLEWAKVAAIPLTGALLAAGVAFWSADVTSDRASDAAYVQLAINTLSRELPESNASEQTRDAEIALRRWAADVLSDSGPVELPDSAADALAGGEISIPNVSLSQYEQLIESCDYKYGERVGFGTYTDERRERYANCVRQAADYAEQLLRQELSKPLPTP
ncbi:hypothetical protein [Microbacterium enclense]|uniref:hypothetical protein n=1 Tax=Microbacterium enclense TaxID=993073 RepID=UPI003F8057D1